MEIALIIETRLAEAGSRQMLRAAVPSLREDHSLSIVKDQTPPTYRNAD